MSGKQGPGSVSSKQRRIAELARQMPEVGLTSLSHHMDLEWMYEAYRRTRKDGAPGVDGQTAREYEENLGDNLRDLLDRAKSGDRYRAPPVRRVHIPKVKGKTRPIGIPTFEDKVLQRAVTMLLNPVYEQDFLDKSYGFRPGHSAHQALDELQRAITRMGGGWVLEADIQAFFDEVDHAILREMYRRRVRDGVVVRLLGKWLKAGVMEQGCVYHPEAGTPQGGVVSPLLANIYLHEVLDTWLENQVRPRMKGGMTWVRYADDFVIVFESKRDAEKVMEVLPKRFAKYGLRLHPEKTRLVRFRRPSSRPGGGKPRGGTFDLLGLTHYWGKSRKGRWVVKRKTQKKRLNRALTAINLWCKTNRHRPIREQHRELGRKMIGHYAYYGVTFNTQGIKAFWWQTTRTWFKWLRRRSHKSRKSWGWMTSLLEHWPLPAPRIYHRLRFA